MRAVQLTPFFCPLRPCAFVCGCSPSLHAVVSLDLTGVDARTAHATGQLKEACEREVRYAAHEPAVAWMSTYGACLLSRIRVHANMSAAMCTARYAKTCNYGLPKGFILSSVPGTRLQHSTLICAAAALTSNHAAYPGPHSCGTHAWGQHEQHCYWCAIFKCQLVWAMHAHMPSSYQ